VATMVVLLGDPDGDFCLRQQLVSKLAALGVTTFVLVRDEQTVGIVLEGWLFDPARSAGAAVEALGAVTGARSLHPVLHLAVSSAIHEGGRHVREIPISQA
jgi:hypothetical protein